MRCAACQKRRVLKARGRPTGKEEWAINSLRYVQNRQRYLYYENKGLVPSKENATKEGDRERPHEQEQRDGGNEGCRGAPWCLWASGVKLRLGRTRAGSNDAADRSANRSLELFLWSARAWASKICAGGRTWAVFCAMTGRRACWAGSDKRMDVRRRGARDAPSKNRCATSSVTEGRARVLLDRNRCRSGRCGSTASREVADGSLRWRERCGERERRGMTWD